VFSFVRLEISNGRKRPLSAKCHSERSEESLCTMRSLASFGMTKGRFRPSMILNIMKFRLKTKENKSKSLWGKGDKDTLKLLNKIRIQGKWLNLAAGDGRYNLNLLKNADLVIASDIDKRVLNKLWRNTPSKYRSKLQIKVFDLTQKSPFKSDYFDGIFCTGILHLVPRKILPKILREMNRVLNKNGKIIIDFATDIKRISFDGKFITIGKEPLYKLQEARKVLRKLFNNYKVKIYESAVKDEIVQAANSYKFSFKFIILVADKNK